MNQVSSLSFNNVAFSAIDRNGQPWLPSSQLATALGYKMPDSISRLYRRNSDEFTESMTQLIEIAPEGQFDELATGINSNPKSEVQILGVIGAEPQRKAAGSDGRMRIFSLRGAHLIAMFARTKVAKDFRKWVLDVLDNLPEQSHPTTFPLSTPTDREALRGLVCAWIGVAGLPYSAAWQQVNAHFNIHSITALPKAWIPDAIKFVQSKIDALQQVALPPVEDDRLADYKAKVLHIADTLKSLQPSDTWDAQLSYSQTSLKQYHTEGLRHAVIEAVGSIAASIEAGTRVLGALQRTLEAVER